MSISATGVDDLFDLLESNKLNEVEEIKKVFHDHFLCTKDNWLVMGLFDYYLSTNSLRAVEVLSGVREPHDKHLLDRLTEAISKPNDRDQRIQAITLLGHITRRQPTWLYKLANHHLFKELLKILKMEVDMLLLMSALLLLVMLLPMLPAALGPYLQEIFEVFGRIAGFHYQQSSTHFFPLSASSSLSAGNVSKEDLYLLHLQVGLYSLFHRLYAMYPCNFIAYLKQQYIQRDQLAIFTHTVRPMLDSVRMHPLLVTASKDTEISATRWKKMEHHDVMAECGRFTLDKCREEVLTVPNSRFTPPIDHSVSVTPVNIHGGLPTTEISNGDESTFWSPSMAVSPNSPPIQTSSHEPRSAPLTPNNNGSGASPPEAAVEATPETTPVKDLRKLSTRQIPVGSSAVRALNALSSSSIGTSSRPSTPTALSVITNSATGSGDPPAHGFISHKINKIMADRQSILQQPRSSTNTEEDKRISEFEFNQNGKTDSWQEDQEVLEIVSSKNAKKIEIPKYIDYQTESCKNDKTHGGLADLSQKVYHMLFYSQCSLSQFQSTKNLLYKIERAKSCPDISETVTEAKLTDVKKEEIGTQTHDLFPYEYLLLGVLDQKNEMNQQIHGLQNTDCRLSPTTMLDRYVEACARTNSFSNDNKIKTAIPKQKQKKNTSEENAGEETGNENGCDDGTNQILQLMQMQLQFERQRREVYAERNRRLLGKLRDSRALEEHNSALTHRLKMMEKEVETFKAELERGNRELCQAKEQYKEALYHWQYKCVEEEQKNRILRECTENLELELKKEQKKAIDGVKKAHAAESAFFDAAHQLKEALKAANRGKELESILNNVQKKFVLLGEVQSKLQENVVSYSPMVKQETAQIQKSYTEELNNLRRQLESRISLVEALKVRLVELEAKEARKEAQIVELQRLIQETKEKHEAELKAIESKYQAQVEINCLLEGRILELHGQLEIATSEPGGVNTANLASSASPKERSPPLSASLASSEGSLAFIQSVNTGIIMSGCCDNVEKISNLQAIVEPASNQVNSPSCSNLQRILKH